jgi:anti-sigma B factor antagonist
MKVEKRKIGKAVVVDVHGDVDMYTSPRLREALSGLTRKRVTTIVVNLQEVKFMDSSGIATLVQAYKEARPFGGEIRLASPGGNVLRVFKLSNLTSLFPVYDSVEKAAET